MSYRPFNNALRDSLYNNEPYIVAHLIKFEKPSITTGYSGISAESVLDYSYMTDAAVDISFDDGSFNRREQYQTDAFALDSSLTSPQSNGEQIYHANKVLNVGTINEGVEAKASSLSLKLDATSLGTTVSASCTFNADQNTIVTDVDLSEEGFVEGDKILFGGGGTNTGLSVVINRFTAGGTTLKATTSGGTWNTQNTTSLYNITQISEELNTLILGNGSVSYTNYINREVTVYRVHIDPNTNAVIGGRPGFTGPGSTYTSGGSMLLFKGIISNASLTEDPKKGTAMTWTLTSHWGDFVRVQNRITQDSEHRALDVTGRPDKNMLIRQEYAGDLGFAHSELALNLIATYNEKETKTRLRYKKKNLGMSKKAIMEEYEVDVPTNVDLKINLKAQALPVIYGVQKIDSIPFFFDNLKNNNTRVYVGYALCEGTIGGVLDIVIDDKTTICVDEKDVAARSAQSEEENIEVVCKGRQDAGNTLVGTPASQGVGIYTHTTFHNAPSLGSRFERLFLDNATGTTGANDEPIYGSHYYTQETRTMDAGGVGFKGIQHEEAFRFKTPIDCTLMFHKGTPSQKANHMLVEKADNNLFKVQNDYFEGNSGSYWTTNHRVLDTAYCVGEYQIERGATEIPSLDFVVRGRDVDCYNYDDSYAHRAAFASENPANFNAGDTVYLTGAGFSEITTTIIDKWSFIDGSGETQHRYRWANAPTPTGYKLRMSTQSGEGGTEWHMEVGNTIIKTGSIANKLSADLAASQAAGKFVLDTNVSSAFELAVSAPDVYELSPGVNDPAPKRKAMFGLRKGNSARGILSISSFGFGGYNSTTNQLSDVVSLPSNVTPDLTEIDVDQLLLRNAIQLPSGGTPNLASTASNSLEYIGATIAIHRFDSVTNIPYTQEREIISWLVSGNDVVAIVDEAWDPGYEPQSLDLFSIKTKKDARVSINPAMQLLDYMKSKRYGKGLEDSDIDLATFKAAAEQCDTRSDVTAVINTSALPVVGDVYKRTFGGSLHFQGTVKSIGSSFTIAGKSSTYREIVFTDVIGKVAQKWDSYNYYAEGQAVWKIDSSGVTRLRRKSGTGGILTDFVGGTSSDITTLQLNKASGSGANAIILDGDPDITSGDGNPLVKSRDGSGGLSASGYSLYDSDNVKYWKYLGWDSRAQRNVTRHQLNQTIDTSNTVFDNINSMLKQFNGILRYANGSYQLSIKSKSPTLSVYEKIVEEDIIGQIKLTDKGSKKTYNSVSASIVDPQNGFETRSVSFFNSEYLRQDNGVPKKGTFATPSISNYFNARFNIKQFLDESRNGLEIQFTARPSGLLLLAGEIVALSYKRFGWDEKLWRITNLNFLANGQVAVTADEHSDAAYVVDASKDSGAGAPSKQSGPGVVALDLMQPPNSLTATTGSLAGIGGIKLLWRHGAGYNPATHDVQVFSSTKNKRTVDVVANGAGTESTSLTVDNASDVAVGTTLANGTSIKTIANGDSYPIAVYEISVVGDTNWAALDRGSETNFGVGDLVVPSSTGTFSGTGQMREIFQTIEVTAVNGNVITLSSPFTWTNDQTITFRATLLAGRLDTSTFTDPVTEVSQSNTTRYYWIRYAVDAPVQNIAGAVSRRQFSAFEPATVAGIEGTNLAANVLRGVDLRVNPGTSFTYETDGTGIDSNYNQTATITAQGINGLGTANYKFEQVTGTDSNGNDILTVLQNYSTDADLVFTPPNAFTAAPGTVRVTFRDTYLGSEYFATAEVTFTGNRITSNGNQGVAGNTFTVTATNMGQKLRALSTGAVPAAEQFASVVKIVKNGSNMPYDGGNSPASGSWHWGTVTEITGGSRFAVQLGSASLTLTGTFYNANTDQNTIEFDVAIEDHQNVTIGAIRYSIEKIPGIRDIGNLKLSITGTPTEVTASGDTFTTYQHSTITTTVPQGSVAASFAWPNTRDWCGGAGGDGTTGNIGHTEMGASTSTSAIKIAVTLVTADADGVKRLRNGDRFRIEVVEDATASVHMGDTYLAGERIYLGATLTEAEIQALSATAKNHNVWSTLVAEKVFGSMIVDGTLSANAVNANDVRTKTLLVESSMVLGTSGTTASSSNKGKIYSAGKSHFGSSTNGFFLGWEGNGAVSEHKAKFHIGDNNDFIKFDGTNLSIKNHGDFTLKSTSSTNTSRLEIVNDVIEIYSGTESTPRVKIGNLS